MRRQLAPRAGEPPAILVAPAFADLEAGALGARFTERLAQHAQQPQQLVRQHIDAGGVAHPLAQRAQAELEPSLVGGIGRLLGERRQRCALDSGDALEALARRVGNPLAQVNRDLQIVGEDAEALQALEHTHALVGREPALQHQLVGADAFVRFGVHQKLDDRQVLRAHRLRKIGPGEFCASLVEGGHPEARRKHSRVVFVALEEAGTLEPRDRRLHSRVRVGVLGRDGDVEVVVGEDLPRRDHDLGRGRARGLAAQQPEDLGDVLRGEPRTRRQTELNLDVLLVVEQRASRVVLVAAGTAGLLQIVLDGARNFGMDDEADVGLVHAHAERVRRGDHAQIAADERLLHRLLDLGRETRVEVAARPPVRPQERGNRFGAPSPRGEHDRAAFAIGELARQDLLDQHELVLLANRHHLVVQVQALVPAGESAQTDAEDLLEMSVEIGDDVELRRRGEAGDLRQLRAVPLADEARGVQIIGAEVVAPLREAMRLVEDPCGDLTVPDSLAQTRVAQLLRRDEQNADVAQPHPVQHVPALGHREEAVQRRGAEDTLPYQAVDLVFHQRLQRRHHDCKAAGAPVARQRRKLVAERFAGAGGQDREHVLAAHRREHNRFLQRAAAGSCWLGPECGEAEVARELPVRVVMLAAIAAFGTSAGRVAKLDDQRARARITLAHPWWEHGVAAGHAQPRQHVSERPQRILAPEIVGQAGEPRRAHLAGEQFWQPQANLGKARARRASNLHEEARKSPVASRRHQVMEAGRLIGAFACEQLERVMLVLEQPRAKLRVAQRIAPAVTQQLVVLDQPVIGILRERDRRQLERIDGRQAGEDRISEVLVQDREVVLDDVVAKHERGTRCEPLERVAHVRVGERSAEDNLFIGVGTPRRQLVDDAELVARCLEVETQALRAELVPYGIHLRSSVAGVAGFGGSGCTVIGPGVWPCAQKRATRRASASFALTGNVS